MGPLGMIEKFQETPKVQFIDHKVFFNLKFNNKG